MEDKSEELNQLQQARKELKEHLEEEFDPQARMEYQAELDSINEKIDEIYTNDDPEVSTTDSKETDEQNLDDENIVDELEEEKEEAAVEALELEEEELE